MYINGKDYLAILEAAKKRIHLKIEGVPSKEKMIDSGADYTIVSDGTAWGTQVYFRGTKLTNIVQIHIEPICMGGKIEAEFKVILPSLHIESSGVIEVTNAY